MNRTYLFATMAIASAALVGCSGGGGGSVATVNGESITKDEYYRFLEMKPRVQVILDLTTLRVPPNTRQVPITAAVSAPLGLQALSDLINRTIMLQLAKDEGVAPTTKQIDDELQFQQELSKKNNGDLLKQMQAEGFNLDEVKRDIAVQLAERNIITKGITISDKEVDDYIKGNPAAFRTQDQALLQCIEVNSDDAKNKADLALKSGQTFLSVAQQYSIEENGKLSNYHYGVQVVPAMPEPIRNAIANLKEGMQTEWLKSGSQWWKFYVEKKTPAKTIEIDSFVKERVRRALAMDRGGKAIDLQKRLQQKLIEAKIEVSDKKMQERWTREMDKLRNAIKNGEAATAATNPTPSTGGQASPNTAPTGNNATSSTAGGNKPAAGGSTSGGTTTGG